MSSSGAVEGARGIEPDIMEVYDSLPDIVSLPKLHESDRTLEHVLISSPVCPTVDEAPEDMMEVYDSLSDITQRDNSPSMQELPEEPAKFFKPSSLHASAESILSAFKGPEETEEPEFSGEGQSAFKGPEESEDPEFSVEDYLEEGAERQCSDTSDEMKLDLKTSCDCYWTTF